MENAKMQNMIRVERAKKRITQAELAEKLHVSRQTIHSIETGKFIPSTVLALKIAKYFEVSFNDIFQLAEEK
jgi:putative transcriptional regulator